MVTNHIQPSDVTITDANDYLVVTRADNDLLHGFFTGIRCHQGQFFLEVGFQTSHLQEVLVFFTGFRRHQQKSARGLKRHL